MLLKRENMISDNMSWFYRLNNHKVICFNIERDRSINSIGLIDLSPEGEDHWHDTKTLCYMEQIVIDDGELLNIDALLALAKVEDNA